MRYILHIFVFLLFGIPVFQVYSFNPQKRDSLLTLLNQASNDSTKAQLNVELAKIYLYSYPDSTIFYSEKSIQIANGKLPSKILANAYYFKGAAFLLTSLYDRAIHCFTSALERFQSLNDKHGLAKCYNSLGIIHDATGKYDEALDYYNEALLIFKELDDKIYIPVSHSNIGNVYYNRGQFDKALEGYKISLDAFIELGDKRRIGVCYNNIGNVYENLGNYPIALEYQRKSLLIKEELEDNFGLTRSYNNVGLIHLNLNEFDKALEYLFQSYHLADSINDLVTKANSSNNIGDAYKKMNEYDKALQYSFLAREIRESIDDKRGIAYSDQYIGEIYESLSSFDTALSYYKSALDIRQELDDQIGVARAYKAMGSVMLRQGDPDKAIQYSKKALDVGEKVGEKKLIKESAEVLTQAYRKMDDFEKAFHYQTIFKNYSDSLLNAENIKIITSNELTYSFEKEKQVQLLEKEKTAELHAAEMEHQKVLRNFFIAASVILLIIIALIIRSYRIIRQQKAEIQQQNDEILDTNSLLELQKTKITDSINYATHIQSAMLPTEDILSKLFSEYFVLNHPKDLIGGDFYWGRQLDDKIYFALADCTGHGIPGAFVSILGISSLNEIIRREKIENAAKVLEVLRAQVKIALKQKDSSLDQADGMDIVFCIIDKKSRKMHFAGANNSMYVIRKKNGKNAPEHEKIAKHQAENEVLYELKGDSQPIGIYGKEKLFTNLEFQLYEKDCIYFFSDGLINQIGGDNNTKFSSRKFKEILLSYHNKTMKEQKTLLEDTLKGWINSSTEQLDDILVLGAKI